MGNAKAVFAQPSSQSISSSSSSPEAGASAFKSLTLKPSLVLPAVL